MVGRGSGVCSMPSLPHWNASNSVMVGVVYAQNNLNKLQAKFFLRELRACQE